MLCSSKKKEKKIYETKPKCVDRIYIYSIVDVYTTLWHSAILHRNIDTEQNIRSVCVCIARQKFWSANTLES